MLTSSENPLLKQVRRAARRGERTPDGWVIAESIHLLEEALRSGTPVHAALVSADADAARRAASRLPSKLVREVSPALFADVASTESSQGLIVLVEPPRWRLEGLFARPGLVVVLDGVQDPGNAGAIVRSAEAFGAAGVLFGTGSASPYHPKTLRASAGSLFRLPYAAGLGADETLNTVRTAGRRLLAAAAREGSPIEEVDWTDAALVVGSEAREVRPELLSHAEPVHIDVEGVESLNAAVAAGVILYQAASSLSATGAVDRARY